MDSALEARERAGLFAHYEDAVEGVAEERHLFRVGAEGLSMFLVARFFQYAQRFIDYGNLSGALEQELNSSSRFSCGIKGNRTGRRVDGLDEMFRDARWIETLVKGNEDTEMFQPEHVLRVLH